MTARLLALVLIVVACGGVDIRADFDVEASLEELRDCDALSETFVTVVREAAEDLDELSERSGGRVPAAELAERVDAITATAYFEVAERLGCSAVQQRLDTVDRLRRLSPDSAAGEELVEEMIRQLETETS